MSNENIEEFDGVITKSRRDKRREHKYELTGHCEKRRREEEEEDFFCSAYMQVEVRADKVVYVIGSGEQ